VVNNFKGSIYMVFDYMDHDLTGLMQRRGNKFEVKHVRMLPTLSAQVSVISDLPSLCDGSSFAKVAYSHRSAVLLTSKCHGPGAERMQLLAPPL